MIETKFIKEIVKEFQIEEFISQTLKNVGFSSAKLNKTPLGEKIVIHASRPGLVVGRKGENIQKLTQSLKSKFKLENPQIEIIEIEEPNLDPKIVAERIASSLERFGLSKFKGIGHKMLANVMDSGAQGVEILISGKIPSSRARRWRFYQGYLKKSGDIAVSGIKKAYTQAQIKTGVVGIQVRIMPPDLKLPDTVEKRTELVKQANEEKPHDENKSKSLTKQKKLPKKQDKKEKEVKVDNKAAEEINEKVKEENKQDVEMKADNTKVPETEKGNKQ